MQSFRLVRALRGTFSHPAGYISHQKKQEARSLLPSHASNQEATTFLLSLGVTSPDNVPSEQPVLRGSEPPISKAPPKINTSVLRNYVPGSRRAPSNPQPKTEGVMDIPSATIVLRAALSAESFPPVALAAAHVIITQYSTRAAVLHNNVTTHTMVKDRWMKRDPEQTQKRFIPGASDSVDADAPLTAPQPEDVVTLLLELMPYLAVAKTRERLENERKKMSAVGITGKRPILPTILIHLSAHAPCGALEGLQGDPRLFNCAATLFDSAVGKLCDIIRIIGPETLVRLLLAEYSAIQCVTDAINKQLILNNRMSGSVTSLSWTPYQIVKIYGAAQAAPWLFPSVCRMGPLLSASLSVSRDDLQGIATVLSKSPPPPRLGYGSSMLVGGLPRGTEWDGGAENTIELAHRLYTGLRFTSDVTRMRDARGAVALIALGDRCGARNDDRLSFLLIVATSHIIRTSMWTSRRTTSGVQGLAPLHLDTALACLGITLFGAPVITACLRRAAMSVAAGLQDQNELRSAARELSLNISLTDSQRECYLPSVFEEQNEKTERGAVEHLKYCTAFTNGAVATDDRETAFAMEEYARHADFNNDIFQLASRPEAVTEAKAVTLSHVRWALSHPLVATHLEDVGLKTVRFIFRTVIQRDVVVATQPLSRPTGLADLAGSDGGEGSRRRQKASRLVAEIQALVATFIHNPVLLDTFFVHRQPEPHMHSCFDLNLDVFLNSIRNVLEATMVSVQNALEVSRTQLDTKNSPENRPITDGYFLIDPVSAVELATSAIVLVQRWMKSGVNGQFIYLRDVASAQRGVLDRILQLGLQLSSIVLQDPVTMILHLPPRQCPASAHVATRPQFGEMTAAGTAAAMFEARLNLAIHALDAFGAGAHGWSVSEGLQFFSGDYTVAPSAPEDLLGWCSVIASMLTFSGGAEGGRSLSQLKEGHAYRAVPKEVATAFTGMLKREAYVSVLRKETVGFLHHILLRDTSGNGLPDAVLHVPDASTLAQLAGAWSAGNQGCSFQFVEAVCRACLWGTPHAYGTTQHSSAMNLGKPYLAALLSRRDALLATAGLLFDALTCNGEWSATLINPLLSFIVADLDAVTGAQVYCEVLDVAHRHFNEDKRKAVAPLVSKVFDALMKPAALANRCDSKFLLLLAAAQPMTYGVPQRQQLRSILDSILAQCDIEELTNFWQATRRFSIHLEPIVHALLRAKITRLKGNLPLNEALTFQPKFLTSLGLFWGKLQLYVERQLMAVPLTVSNLSTMRVDAVNLNMLIRKAQPESTGGESGGFSKEICEVAAEYAAHGAGSGGITTRRLCKVILDMTFVVDAPNHCITSCIKTLSNINTAGLVNAAVEGREMTEHTSRRFNRHKDDYYRRENMILAINAVLTFFRKRAVEVVLQRPCMATVCGLRVPQQCAASLSLPIRDIQAIRPYFSPESHQAQDVILRRNSATLHGLDVSILVAIVNANIKEIIFTRTAAFTEVLAHIFMCISVLGLGCHVPAWIEIIAELTARLKQEQSELVRQSRHGGPELKMETQGGSKMGNENVDVSGRHGNSMEMMFSQANTASYVPTFFTNNGNAWLTFQLSMSARICLDDLRGKPGETEVEELLEVFYPGYSLVPADNMNY